MAFEIESDGEAVKFVPFPKIDVASKKYRLPPKDKAAADLEEALGNFPDLKVKRSRKLVTVTGDVNSIAGLEAFLVARQTIADNSRRTFTLNLTATKRGDILATIAQQTGRNLELVGDAGQILSDQISIAMTDVSLEQLIGECIAGTDLGYQLDEKTLKVYPIRK